MTYDKAAPTLTQNGHGSGFEDDNWDPETLSLLSDIFAGEAHDHLDVISACAMTAGKNESASFSEALRRAHTLKGSAATVGFQAIQQGAHLLEERILDLERSDSAEQEATVDVILEACDLLRQMLVPDLRDDARATLQRRLFEVLQRRRRSGDQARDLPAAEPHAAAPTRAALDEQPRSLPRKVLSSVVKAVEDEGGAVVAGRTARPLEAETHTHPDEFPTALPEAKPDEGNIVRVDVDRLDELMNAVGQLVIERSRIDRRVEDLKGLVRDLLTCGEALGGAINDLRHDGAEQLDQKIVRLLEIEKEVAHASQTLDRTTAKVVGDSDGLRRATSALQQQLARVRMMPLRWLFARLQRPMRDLARSEGKRVRLQVLGESTELDRSVVEKITDPLIHLVRNAVAHGIEPPGVRIAAGKPPAGVVSVQARHQGDFVSIEVEDDGAGIDFDALRTSLKSWPHSDTDVDRMSEAELLDCLFLSGFSTRQEATSLAGRGMGLDVVRRNVAALGGTISVQSRPKQGCSFALRLPMTTAIAHALLFKEEDVVYSVLVCHVAEVVEVAGTALRRASGGGYEVNVHERWLPLLWLPEILGRSQPFSPLESSAPARMRYQMIVLSVDNRTFVLSGGKLVGPREIVLTRLGPLLGLIPLLSGATVSGSGKVQFVLDVAWLDAFVHGRARRPSSVEVLDEAGALRPQMRSVLVVDDSRSIREVVAMVLRGGGYQVDVAADGWEAWAKLQRQEYDLLITDLEMPRLDGFELIRRCRAYPGTTALPICVLTSRMADDKRELALADGADLFITKPVSRRIILDKIAALIDSRAVGSPRLPS